ncbi:MAG TPA: DUF4440 domain-containing protein [Dongiaceae bacterium]|jgi:hypothetical protein|nr:DUF4440 domain-containing protein [Dongiaceae bacterium]
MAEDFFRELEESLFKPEVRASASAIDRLLADDFVEFGSSGLTFDKKDVIDGLQSEPTMQRALTDFRASPLAPDVVLLTYRSIRHGDSGERHFLRSSIWKNFGGQWRMVFHQGTPTQAG